MVTKNMTKKEIFYKVAKTLICFKFCVVFFLGLIYTARQLNGLTDLGEICLWASLVLILIGQFYRCLMVIFECWEEEE